MGPRSNSRPRGRRRPIIINWAGPGAPALQQRAGLLEGEARTAGEQLRAVSVAEVAQEVRAHVALGEVLLVAPLAFGALAEELLVDLRVVEAGHGAAVEAHGPGGDD